MSLNRWKQGSWLLVYPLGSYISENAFDKSELTLGFFKLM